MMLFKVSLYNEQYLKFIILGISKMNKENIDKFEIFPWNKNLEVGIKEIDEQHQQIVILLNKLANLLTHEELFHVEDAFAELAEYADFHFKCEEKIWEKYIKNDDLVSEHKHSHASFLPKVLEMKEKNKDKPYNEIIEDILLFLIRWLAFHIVDEDKRLALIINSLNDGKNISEAIYVTDEIMSGSMRGLIETILSMYDSLSIKAINLIRERKRRIKAEKELRIINKKLEELSITDQLTSLYNRRYFDDTFTREIEKAKRHKTIISVMLIDIDYFKKLNDTYGHAVGDKALISVAKCLKTICKRSSDFAFRVGGEEFTIIITNEDTSCAISLSEVLQKEIASLQIENKNSLVANFLTISGGLVSKIPAQNDTIDSIMKLADEKLYRAKETGRNQIVID